MLKPDRPVEWVVISATLALILGLLFGWWFGRGRPAPGDVIILKPDPVSTSLAQSSYFVIGGDPAIAVYEAPASTALNRNAFMHRHKYVVYAKDPQTGNIVSVVPDELTASFGHCSDIANGVLHACTTDADCTQFSATCVTSTMRLTLDQNNKFHWYLTTGGGQEMELQEKSYPGPDAKRMWRAEFCGTLIGYITCKVGVTQYVVTPGANLYAWINAKHP